MLQNFIITFRETLEAALIIGIILSYLARIKQTKYNNVIYIGVAAGIIASIIGALIFTEIAGGNVVFAFGLGPGRQFAVAVLGSSYDGRFEDALKIYAAAKEWIKP